VGWKLFLRIDCCVRPFASTFNIPKMICVETARKRIEDDNALWGREYFTSRGLLVASKAGDWIEVGGEK